MSIMWNFPKKFQKRLVILTEFLYFSRLLTKFVFNSYKKNMEKYDDFALWSPSVMEKIAKQYALKLKQKEQKFDPSELCELARQNLTMLESLPQTQSVKMQKHYIKTYALYKQLLLALPKQDTKNASFKKNATYNNTNNQTAKSTTQIDYIYQACLKNLCQIMQVTLNQNLQSLSLATLEAIKSLV